MRQHRPVLLWPATQRRILRLEARAMMDPKQQRQANLQRIRHYNARRLKAGLAPISEVDAVFRLFGFQSVQQKLHELTGQPENLKLLTR